MFEPAAPTWSDGLTGLSNHGAFQKRLAALIETGAAFRLLILDLDHFKTVNAMTFQARGDRVLQRTAEALRALSPGPDSTFRYGGDEFAVVLPGVDDATAVDLAERLCAAIAAIEIPDWDDSGEPAPRHLTCSVGVAAYPSAGHTTATIVNAAEGAMLAAKRAGDGLVRTSEATPFGVDKT